MSPFAPTEDIYEERIARFIDLAEAAEDAAGCAVYPGLHETYVHIAGQWTHLAQLAKRTIEISKKARAL